MKTIDALILAAGIAAATSAIIVTNGGPVNSMYICQHVDAEGNAAQHVLYSDNEIEDDCCVLVFDGYAEKTSQEFIAGLSEACAKCNLEKKITLNEWGRCPYCLLDGVTLPEKCGRFEQ